jgi:hypothetical protein
VYVFVNDAPRISCQVKPQKFHRGRVGASRDQTRIDATLCHDQRIRAEPSLQGLTGLSRKFPKISEIRQDFIGRSAAESIAIPVVEGREGCP